MKLVCLRKTLSLGRRPWTVIVRAVVSILLLGFMIWRVSPGRLLSLWRDAEPVPLVGAFLLLLMAQVLSGYKWGLLLRTYQPTVRSAWAIRTYFVGMFFSTILPWSYAGDGVRSYVATTEMTLPLKQSIATVVIDRLTGYLALFLFGLLALAFLYWPLPVTLALAVVGAAGLILMASLLPRYSSSIRSLPGPASQFLAERTLAVSLREALLLSFVFHSVAILALGLIIRGCGLHLPWAYIAVAELATSTASVVPVSLGGIGLRELSLATLLTAHGASSEEATAVAFAYGLTFVALGLSGGLVLLLRQVALMRGSLTRLKAEETL
jgi:uncharacterized membrane protein YbhN (UPF0104 family)